MPSSSANLKLILIWEHEIVEAVKLFDKLRQEKNPSADEITNAIKAAYTAIYNPDILDGNPFVIMSANRHFIPEESDNAKCP